MAKKTKKETSKTPPSAHGAEIRGLLFLAAALSILLSLSSFSLHGPFSHNWLGVLGYGIGWSFTALFGVCGYLICFYLMWIGWRLLFKKPLNRLFLETSLVFIAIASLCILLSLLEDNSIRAAVSMKKFFFNYAYHHKIHYHLGGAPFYYLYRDMPYFNLLYMLNAIGVLLVFSSSLLATLFFIVKLSPQALLTKAFALFRYLKPPELCFSDPQPTDTAPPAAPPSPIEKKKESDSDFMRYVKLRIPHSSTGTQEQPSQAQDLLAIQPEQNLKVRPSLSSKETTSKIIEKKVAADKAQETPPPPEPKSATQKVSRRDAALNAQRIHNGDFSTYLIPSSSLLTQAKKNDQSSLKKDLLHDRHADAPRSNGHRTL